MTKRTKKSGNSPVKRALPYIISALAVLGLVFYGSLDKSPELENNMNMESIAADNFSVSADQISQFFMVSELASSLSLPTADAVNVNYNSLSVMRDTGQTTVEKLEKPDIVDISDVVCDETYTVKAGETLDYIAARCGVTTTQLRWSNGLKNDTIAEGYQLKIPSVPGIVYIVKRDENAGSIAGKYNSDAETIIAHNCPTNDDCIKEGMTITIPSGELPETERPEYVAPSRSSSSGSSYTATRTYSTSVNQMPWGWCTWFAWQWRYDNMGDSYTLPGGLGNASTWANSLRAGYGVDKSPAYGDVFVSYAGYYGHVGIVTGVNADGSITITDMNGQAGWGQIGTRTVDRGEWASWQFIHGKK